MADSSQLGAVERWLGEVNRFTTELARLADELAKLPADASESERASRLAELSHAMQSCAVAGAELARVLSAHINIQ